MLNQRLPSTHNGRRTSDFLKRVGLIFSTILAVTATLALVGGAYVKGAQINENTEHISALTQKVTILEQIKNDDHYMTCFMFQRVNPDGVPASCSLALRQRTKP